MGKSQPHTFTSVILTSYLDTSIGTYLILPQNTLWACSTGLTPCVHTRVLQSTDFCILALLLPKITYFSQEAMAEHLVYSPLPLRHKRAIEILIPALVGLGIAGAAGIGTTAFVVQDQNYKNLRKAMDDDLAELEKSITNLQQSLNSLAEVVLQNRRGLDLLFLQQGGLCLALGEECCFYANHYGVIKESMALVCRRLQERANAHPKMKTGVSLYFPGPLC